MIASFAASSTAWFAAGVAAVATTLVVVFLLVIRSRNMGPWLPALLRNDWSKPAPQGVTRHLMFCFVDHFEPAWESPGLQTERRRVERWLQEYPQLCEGLADADGRSPVHTFFYPGEEYRPEHLDDLVALCRRGFGEIEIHLHHDRDTADGLRQKLRAFTGQLVARHGALPIDEATARPLWAFIHGNWALDNSHPHGLHCGVDNELRVLAEEGCYADFTLPAAPDPCQTRTINRIYYARGRDGRRKSHDRGTPVSVGGQQVGDLVIVQGPLGLMWSRPKFGFIPRIENADVRTSSPPTPARIDAWVRTGIHVEGRPEWVFVKVHTHGTQERDTDTVLGRPMREAFEYLGSRYNDGTNWKLHYVSARETFNIIKAAEAGAAGDPGAYRDFIVKRPSYVAARTAAMAG